MTADLGADLATLGPVTGALEGNGYTQAIGYPLGAVAGDPLAWVREHRDALLGALRTYGAVQLGGLPVDVDLFAAVVEAVGGPALPYTERSTPRTAVTGGIYTSTEYPADQAIPMHNENSYADTWPTTLFFLCQVAADTGGGTPIADSRAVFRLVPPQTRARFAGGVVYTRTFTDGIGLSWQETFQTGSREEVEAYCARHDQRYEWTADGLRTRSLRPATRREPYAGAEVWFNQANLFSVSALEEEVREALLASYDEADLPRNAYLGDGSPIPPGDLAAIEDAYRAASLVLPWRPGNLLIVDNMLMAHGREPYRGDRRVLVAMS